MHTWGLHWRQKRRAPLPEVSHCHPGIAQRAVSYVATIGAMSMARAALTQAQIPASLGTGLHAASLVSTMKVTGMYTVNKATLDCARNVAPSAIMP